MGKNIIKTCQEYLEKELSGIMENQYNEAFTKVDEADIIYIGQQANPVTGSTIYFFQTEAFIDVNESSRLSTEDLRQAEEGFFMPQDFILGKIIIRIDGSLNVISICEDRMIL